MKVCVHGWHLLINHMKALYFLKRYCHEAMLYDILGGGNTPFLMDITIYTTEGCKWCTRMKELLDRADLQYTEVLVSSLPAEEKKELKEKYSDMISYPYAVIDNELIGGLVPVAKLLLQKCLVSSSKNERT